MTPVTVSTFICDRQKNLEYVMSDGLKLTNRIDIKNLRDMFNDKSLGKLQLFFENCEKDRAVMNWELWPLMPISYQNVFVSGLLWLNLVVLRISDSPLQSFFFDVEVNSTKPAALFFPIPEDEVEDDSSSNYRINNELSSLQRSLQRKNIHLEELNERLEVLATIDPLTGMFNRRSILNRAENELERAKRTNQYFGLAVVDIDDIKNINDRYGTAIGDQSLIELSRILNISTRSYDGAGRIGGDEFLVYLALSSKSQLGPILERIHEKAGSIKIKISEEETLSVKASIGAVGLSAMKNPNTKVAQLLVQAFEALYQSKEMGKIIVTLDAFPE